ncbi:ABC transporter substrate-binding protein [Gleimia hominis]|uniref:ABC transporter substrate-binding protein n=1 Tax=Gleimia hominis TaxID=595468 RepID=UPI000C80C0C8|nr:ABC transporter substrate-binding protein [Gleimia hominis]WIK63677.1 ABC transporter substrate-binding protein [Gleimia hominis]
MRKHKSTQNTASNGTVSRRTALMGALLSPVALAACSNADPFRQTDSDSANPTLVVGSSQYYSAEIIAEAYAQGLEKIGFKVRREMQIGSREVVMPEMEAGAIDIFPEYAGNLLQYYDKDSKARTFEEIWQDLPRVLPKQIHAFSYAQASDQDSYNVTSETAEKHGVKAIGDLKKLGGTVKVGANAEFKDRPYGTGGLKRVYGVESTLVPIQDSGGPLTVKALLDKDVQVANTFSTDPAIKKNKFVTLEDPESMILPQNVMTLGSDRVPLKATAVVERINAALDQDTLINLNARSVDEQAAASTIARDWLESLELLK